MQKFYFNCSFIFSNSKMNLSKRSRFISKFTILYVLSSPSVQFKSTCTTGSLMEINLELPSTHFNFQSIFSTKGNPTPTSFSRARTCTISSFLTSKQLRIADNDLSSRFGNVASNVTCGFCVFFFNALCMTVHDLRNSAFVHSISLL